MKGNINTDKIATTMISEGAGRKAHICPFLGLKDDPLTALAFPSDGNHCFHARPVLPVQLECQKTFCLSINHPNCEEFIRPPDTPLPPGLRLERSHRSLRNFSTTSLLTLLLVLAAVGLIIWQVYSRGFLGNQNRGLVTGKTVPAFSTVAGLQTLPVSPMQAQSTPIPTLTMMASATPLPSPTSTPTIEPSHALETPIGIDRKLIIHRVLDGESLPFLASLYWTTIEAIQAVNYSLPSPVRVGWLLIIPTNQTDVSGLPAFEAYQVKADVAVETLAKQLSVDPALLKLHNGLHDGEILSAGEWLLVPHLGTAIP